MLASTARISATSSWQFAGRHQGSWAKPTFHRITVFARPESAQSMGMVKGSWKPRGT
jgi:hypothetical protein